MIQNLSGDDLGVCRNDNFIVKEWADKGRVVFSAAKLGDSMTCHFAANKKALRHIKGAIDEFIEWVFSNYDWCKMILAIVERNSVKNLVVKCGFSHVLNRNNHDVYMRCR